MKLKIEIKESIAYYCRRVEKKTEVKCPNKLLKADIQLGDTENEVGKKKYQQRHDAVRKNRKSEIKAETRHEKKSSSAVEGRNSEMGDHEGEGCNHEKNPGQRDRRTGLKTTTTLQKNVNNTALTKLVFIL